MSEATPAQRNAALRTLEQVRVTMRVELGRAFLPVHEIERLAPGAVVSLERLAGEPVELRCAGRLVAYGEMVVQDEAFAVRVVEIARRQPQFKDRFGVRPPRRPSPR